MLKGIIYTKNCKPCAVFTAGQFESLPAVCFMQKGIALQSGCVHTERCPANCCTLWPRACPSRAYCYDSM